MMEHDSGACIYGALISIDTNDIFLNNEFPILDVERKIISKDNGKETIKLNGFELINDVAAKGERGLNVSYFLNEAISKSFKGAFGIVWSRPLVMDFCNQNGNIVLCENVGECAGEVIAQEDMNLKLLRSLPSVMEDSCFDLGNKEEIEDISCDDFTNSNSSTNEADNTAYGVSAAHTQSNPTSGDNLSDAVICAFLARNGHVTFRAEDSTEDRQKLLKIKNNEGRENDIEGTVFYDSGKLLLKIALVAKASELEATMKSFSSDSEGSVISPNLIRDIIQFPPPYTRNFIPFKPDITFMDEIVESENIDVITVITPSNVKKVESNHESADVKNNGDAVEPKTVRKNQSLRIGILMMIVR
ncbi:hypothetical protein Tco_0806353 [Tanacetum coccineum]